MKRMYSIKNVFLVVLIFTLAAVTLFAQTIPSGAVDGHMDKIKTELTGSKEKCDILLNIRNAIYHNQFPVFMDAIEKAQGENIADKMLSITENYVKYITEQIS